MGYITLFVIHYTNSLNRSLCIFIKNKFREFDKRSEHFPSGDYFINSHKLFLDVLMILFGRKFMFVNLRS